VRLGVAGALFVTGLGAQSVDGIWQGTLDAGRERLRIILRLAGGAGTVQSVDEGKLLPAVILRPAPGMVRLEMESIGAVFEGAADSAGTILKGEWRQSGASLPVAFHKVEREPDAVRPQDPRRPFPYREKEVTVASGEIRLAGTLTLPRGGKAPAVLLIGGSGPQDRNGSIAGHRPFLVIADYLTRRGIAVLRLDDRGVGSSTGNLEDATTADLASDAFAAAQFLRSREELDAKRIGLIGHSEGGLVAALAAARSPAPAFVCLLATPALPGDRILALQNDRILLAMGATAEAAAVNRKLQQSLIEAVRGGVTDPGEIRSRFDKIVAETPEEQRAAAAALAGRAETQLEAALTPWFRFFLTYDPRPALERLRVPVLAIAGANDLQVPPRENLPELVKALEAAGNPNYRVIKLPGLNHLMQPSESGSPAEYSRIEQTIAVEVLELIRFWISEIVPIPSR
jgi:pimeloyl-ACP methyl ester carboxylesterase